MSKVNIIPLQPYVVLAS